MMKEDALPVLDEFLNDMSQTVALRMAVNTAYRALIGPQPDPETGLYDCRCGGKPELVPDGDDMGVSCDKCTASTWTREDWNAVMGGGTK